MFFIVFIEAFLGSAGGGGGGGGGGGHMSLVKISNTVISHLEE